MPHFVVVCHTIPPGGSWGLDDLLGDAGRADVACRAVTNALFVSHGIRSDTQVTLVLIQGPVAVRFDGAELQNLNPDERSTAARLRDALRTGHGDPWWQDVSPGIQVAGYGLADVLEEVGEVVMLHRDGDRATPPADATFVLSDHQAFTGDEERLLADAQRLSLGDTWYHGHHAVGIVQYLLDGGQGA